jgi:signal transduction histidine kinase/ActR/RegA family two-component response regulator
MTSAEAEKRAVLRPHVEWLREALSGLPHRLEILDDRGNVFDDAGESLPDGVACVEAPVLDGGVTIARLRLLAPDAERRRALLEHAAAAAARELVHRANRAVAERTADRLARLHTVASALAAAWSREDIARIVVTEGYQALRAAAGVFYYVEQDQLRLGASRGVLVDFSAYESLPFDSPLPAAVAARTGEALWYDSWEQIAAIRPYLAEQQLVPRSVLQALLAVPVRSSGRVVGAMAFSFDGPRVFDAEERRFVLTLADHVALAADRARLVEQEQRARAEADAARIRALYLARAGEIVASSVDHGDTLDRVLRLIVPGVADQAAVHVIGEGGALELAGLAHQDPAEERRAKERLDRERPEIGAPSGPGAVAASGRLERFGGDPGPRGGTRAGLYVPLVANGQVRGVLELTSSRPGRSYGPDDVAFATELAGRCAMALQNARMHRDAQRLQAEMQRAHTLESLGVLAGGIAHDFNNLLTGVLGNLTLAQRMVAGDARVMKRLEDAERAALRSRDLTRQLLTFAKGGAPVRQLASLRETVSEIVGFVLSGSNVRPQLRIASDLWLAEVDLGQLAQVVQNLVINALQAMPGGGTVDVTLENERRLEAGGLPLAPGAYVRLEVRDRGVGIAPDQLPRIFDPFFTTKATGSGLGLTTAYAIARRHGGHIEVQSAVGKGSRFVLRLPAMPDGAPEARRAPTPVAEASRGRILVMDDEPAVRGVIADLLRALGHEAVVAEDGERALAAWRRARQDGRPFDVVILDLTVPGRMGGRQVVLEMRAVDPDVRALVSSGYSDDPVLSSPGEYGFAGVLKKPYTLDEVARALGVAMSGAPA